MTSTREPHLSNRQAADQFEVLARRLDLMGCSPEAERAYRLAADFDFVNDGPPSRDWDALPEELIRRRIFEDLLGITPVDSIALVGASKSARMAWLAQRFSGRIFVCETRRRYLLQAQARLSDSHHVVTKPTAFDELLDRLREEFPWTANLIFHFDAHWPSWAHLIGQITAVRRSFYRSIVVVDDFAKVLAPDGVNGESNAGRRVGLDLLAPFRGCAGAFLPPASSSGHAGAGRGVCVLVWDRTVAERVSGVPALRSAVDEDWLDLRRPAGLNVSLQASDNAERSGPVPGKLAAPARPNDSFQRLGMAASRWDAETVKTIVADVLAEALSSDLPDLEIRRRSVWNALLPDIRRSLTSISDADFRALIDGLRGCFERG